MPAPPTFPFVVGCPRSGTTLLRAMLDSHPELAIPLESFFVPDFAAIPREQYDPHDVLLRLLAHERFRRWQLPDTATAEAVRSAVDGVGAIRALYLAYARHHGKARYADKTPQYVLRIDRLAALFPEARFVHLVRDGRDVALSLLDAPFGPSRMAAAARTWQRHVVRGIDSGRSLPDDRYLEVRYEALVASPEPALRSICTFLELPWTSRMLDYTTRADDVISGTIHPDAHRSIRLPPTTALRDWHVGMEPRAVGVFESVAGDVLASLGYERAVPTPTPLHRLECRRQLGFGRVRSLRRHFGSRSVPRPG